MKKILGIMLSAVLMMSAFSATAFAAEVTPENTETTAEATAYDVEISSEGIVSVTDENGNDVTRSMASSISGYDQGNVNSGNPGFLVWVNTSGIGGMGITVETSCSSWNGTVTLDVLGQDGSHPVSGKYISSNGHVEYHNLLHANPAYYLINFSGIPSGHTIFAKVWIYG